MTPEDIAQQRIDECRRTRSTSLDLSKLGLTEIPTEVFELTWLEKLDVSEDWERKEAKGKITETPAAIKQLTALTEFNCAVNQISDLSPLSALPALQSLDCSDNQISDLSPLSALPALQSLTCWNNQISDLSPLSALPALQSLDCGSNEIQDFCPIDHLLLSGQLKHFSFYNSPKSGIPPILLGSSEYDNCLENIKYYRQAILAHGSVTQKQLKIQLVGNGRVGKTTLAYVLEHKRAPNEPFKSTHGIVIKEILQALDGEDEPVTLQLWDFGGQEIYHATHRLFLSNDCLYLLLWAEETEEHPDETRHPVSYWLESIHDLGKTSPVILVKNQIDSSDRLPTRPPELTEDLPGVDQIRQEVKISAMQPRGIPALRGAIEAVLEELKHRVSLELPTSWLRVQRELEQLRPQKTIPFTHFKQLCRQAGVGHAEWFASYLHKTGVLFYQESTFQDRIILDQNWAINAIYRVFDPKGHRELIEQMRGRFKGAYTQIFWPDANETERNIYLDFMRNCGICYEPNRKHDIPFADRTFIIPALLPEKSPTSIAWHKNATDWQLNIEYPFLHRSIIERIILRLGETYQGDPWRTGVFCDTEHGQVLLECEYLDKKQSTQGQLSFHLRGIQLEHLVYAMRKLVSETSPHRHYSEFLIKVGEERIPLPEFKDEKKEHGSRLDARKPADKTIKLFISYSRADGEHKLTLEKHLRLIKDALKYRVNLEIWSDYLMDAGEGVNDQILPELRSADLIVLVVSPDFLDPERYSCREELPIALERHEKERIPVAPVIIRHTHWQERLGHLTVPTKENADPLEDWPSADKFWGSVQKGIREQVEKLMKKAG
jgi:GTPase SAR1 family protein